MMAVFKMFFTTLYSFFSGLNNLAVSFDDITSVVQVNAKAFKDQELLEAEAKTTALRDKLKEVA